MKNLILTTLIVSISTFLGSNIQCFGAKKTSISSNTWSLVELSGEQITPKAGRFSLIFSHNDSKFSGMAECNRYFGTFKLKNKKLSFGHVGSTRMMCPNQQLESKYFELLNKVDSYSLSKNTLKLKNKGTVILVFNIAPEKPKTCELPVTLDAHSWKVTEINGENISSEEDLYTITFDKTENKFFGMGNCNRFFGIFSTTNKTQLKIENMGSTQMMCPDQTTEDLFFIIVNEIDSYQIEKNILLLKSKGSVKITLKAIPKIQVEK